MDPITEDDVWANVARNLSRQPAKELATDLLDRANKVHAGTVRSLATAFQPKQQREAQGMDGTTLHRTRAQRRDERDVAGAAPAMQAAAARSAASTQQIAGLLARPRAGDVRKAVQAARRSMRRAASRPKQGRNQPMSPTDTQAEAQSDFAEALRRAGLKPKGLPIMDGKMHRVPVEGDKRGKQSGSYVGHLDGTPAGYINNFKTGEQSRWKTSRPHKERSPEQRQREAAHRAGDQAARAAARKQAQGVPGAIAHSLWTKARPARAHPYLKRKGVGAHGLKIGIKGQGIEIMAESGKARRISLDGRLFIPMRDINGKIWNVQAIEADGTKRYLAEARKQGMHATLGTIPERDRS